MKKKFIVEVEFYVESENHAGAKKIVEDTLSKAYANLLSFPDNLIAGVTFANEEDAHEFYQKHPELLNDDEEPITVRPE